MVNVSYYYFAELTANGGANYGPLNPGSITKLYRARCRGSIGGGWSGGFTTANPTYNSSFIGIQMVGHGDTPINIVTGSEDPQALVTYQIPVEAGLAVFAPDTDTFAGGTLWPIDLEWRGQQFVGANVDFYFSWGQPVSLGAEGRAYGALQVVWT